MTDRRRPYRVLQYRDFRRLWFAQFISLIGSQMQVAAINWHVYVLTGSALALGMVGLIRVIPIVLFALGGGLLADRLDRRWLMFCSQTAMALLAAILCVMTYLGHDTLWGVYLLTGCSSAAFAFDSPARQSLVPKLVPAVDLPGALALNLAMFHSAMITGPALAGLLIASGGVGSLQLMAAAHKSGLALIYGLNALSFVAVLVALARMETSGTVEGVAPGPIRPLKALEEGLGFVFRTPIMVSTMTLDFFATFFSGALTLLPIFADRVLGVGPSGYGALVAAPAVGALLGSLAASLRNLPRRTGVVLLWSVGLYGASTVVFGLSHSFLLTLAALAAGGAADVVSTVIRQTIRQLLTPDALRGRMTSVNMIFFMGGPQLGEMEAGVVAALFASEALGASVSVASGGVITILVTLLVAWKFPVVRKYRSPS